MFVFIFTRRNFEAADVRGSLTTANTFAKVASKLTSGQSAVKLCVNDRQARKLEPQSNHLADTDTFIF